MISLTTHGIRITVSTFYEPDLSRPILQKYVHSYRITIANESDVVVQLLERQWYIHDSNGLVRDVQGEGVIGKQPTIEPGQEHQYISQCPLMTDMGRMYGYYTMQLVGSEERIEVDIPEFALIAPFKRN